MVTRLIASMTAMSDAIVMTIALMAYSVVGVVVVEIDVVLVVHPLVTVHR